MGQYFSKELCVVGGWSIDTFCVAAVLIVPYVSFSPPITFHPERVWRRAPSPQYVGMSRSPGSRGPTVCPFPGHHWKAAPPLFDGRGRASVSRCPGGPLVVWQVSPRCHYEDRAVDNDVALGQSAGPLCIKYSSCTGLTLTIGFLKKPGAKCLERLKE